MGRVRMMWHRKPEGCAFAGFTPYPYPPSVEFHYGLGQSESQPQSADVLPLGLYTVMGLE
jgi:hypothetical protein